jgi:hypothetical protein
MTAGITSASLQHNIQMQMVHNHTSCSSREPSRALILRTNTTHYAKAPHSVGHATRQPQRSQHPPPSCNLPSFNPQNVPEPEVGVCMHEHMANAWFNLQSESIHA